MFYRHPGDNPFYSNIDSMPDIRPRRKSIPLVSELVSNILILTYQYKPISIITNPMEVSYLFLGPVSIRYLIDLELFKWDVLGIILLYLYSGVFEGRYLKLVVNVYSSHRRLLPEA